ncbi:MAG: class I SAM-dependent methyltransferase [Luteimonas sp.]
MGASPLNPAAPAWRSLAQWRADAAQVHQADAARVEALGEELLLDGHCRLCDGSHGFFRLASTPADLREGLACARCHCNARQRAAAMLLLDALDAPKRARVYATEQASPMFVALRRRIPQLRGSEYAPRFLQRLRLSAWLCRKGVATWVRREDVTALGFGDGSLDAVISLDVLEHVPDYPAALREFARVLRPGGVLVLTIPFYDDRTASEVIARVGDDGRVQHLGEPEFHGDPISDGVACFHHFGWNLLDAMGDAGFEDAAACRVHDAQGGLPQGLWVLRARR